MVLYKFRKLSFFTYNYIFLWSWLFPNQVGWVWSLAHLEFYKNQKRPREFRNHYISWVKCSHWAGQPARSWNAAANIRKMSVSAMWIPHILGLFYMGQLQTQHFKRHSCFYSKTPCTTPMWVPDMIHVLKMEWYQSCSPEFAELMSNLFEQWNRHNTWWLDFNALSVSWCQWLVLTPYHSVSVSHTGLTTGWNGCSISDLFQLCLIRYELSTRCCLSGDKIIFVH